MNTHKKIRLGQKSTKQPIANKLVTINRIASQNGLTSSTFDPDFAFSVMNSAPAIFFLGTAGAHRQLFSKK